MKEQIEWMDASKHQPPRDTHYHQEVSATLLVMTTRTPANRGSAGEGPGPWCTTGVLDLARSIWALDSVGFCRPDEVLAWADMPSGPQSASLSCHREVVEQAERALQWEVEDFSRKELLPPKLARLVEALENARKAYGAALDAEARARLHDARTDG